MRGYERTLPLRWARVSSGSSRRTPIPPADPTRIAANVVTGVGFLGAGVILRDRGRTVGLTTAATLWATAAVGLALAFGMYVIGTLCAVTIFALLAVHDLPGWRRRSGSRTASRDRD